MATTKISETLTSETLDGSEGRRFSDLELGTSSIEEMDEEDNSSVGSSNPDLSAHSDREETLTIGQRETIMVLYSKVMVVAVILVVALVIGVITHSFVLSQEEARYKKEYTNLANEIVSTSQSRAQAVFDNLETFSVSLTSQAASMGMEWPFVLFPDFQVQGMLSNLVTGAETITLQPIVWHDQRSEWESFSLQHAKEWLGRGHAYDKTVSHKLYQEIRLPPPPPPPAGGGAPPRGPPRGNRPRWNESDIWPTIVGTKGTHEWVVDWEDDYYNPLWQRAPAEDFSPATNMNFAHIAQYGKFIEGMFKYDRAIITTVSVAFHLAMNYDNRFEFSMPGPPHSYILQPVYDTLLENRTIVAALSAFMRWDQFFIDTLPDSEHAHGILVVVKGTCGQTYSFQLNGKQVVYLNDTDVHDPIFNGMGRKYDVIAPFEVEDDDPEGFCTYDVTIYPTQTWKSQFYTNEPILYALTVIGCFLATTLVFVLYDLIVEHRHNVVETTANQTSAIVSSLYPATVRSRLMEELNSSNSNTIKEYQKHFRVSKPTQRSSSSSNLTAAATPSVSTSELIFGSKPIADLFPHTTIMFADLAGFTAWSSSREPTQVFTLLETVYHAFDAIAKRRRVFKVETIGDCYVAVVGLPMPRKDHAVVMAKFASDCLKKMVELSHELEPMLGPDTAELGMRCGLHSGPVTAGVLRGEKGRFQLFGDTMNTASRMESTGVKNRIQVSQETADLLQSAGKGKWLHSREEKVHAKGKGELTTYWLQIQQGSMTTSSAVSHDCPCEPGCDPLDQSISQACFGTRAAEAAKVQRLVQWNVDILAKLLCEIMAHRASRRGSNDKRKPLQMTMDMLPNKILEEAKDVMALPSFNASIFKNRVDPSTVQIAPDVHTQLTKFVSRIADLYRDNPFHGFEHASHVVQSATKLLARIVNPIEVEIQKGQKDGEIAASLHGHTYGITSDPLTQFAVVLSALIHDVDHPGVSNAILVAEKDPVAIRFDNKSVAEQNSVAIAWDLLMDPAFEQLRSCIFTTREEFLRFRQILVNLVLATDIMDKELGALRKQRWGKVFSRQPKHKLGAKPTDVDDAAEDVNRKATIVLEHLIQASDVSHTMQHWHVYRQWNEKLFQEVYGAYLEGRLDKDPSERWYEGEIGFFDFYIVPLAKKLKTCGIFGVSSDEYLAYAENNRKEWVEKGKDIVQGYLSSYGRPKVPLREGFDIDC